MPLISLTMAFLAGISVYAGVHFLFHFLRSQRIGVSDQRYLLFSLLCFFVVGYMSCEVWAYQAQNASDYVDAFTWRLTFAAFFLMTFPWFVSRSTGVGPQWLLWALSAGLFFFLLIPNLLRPYGAIFDQLPELKVLSFPWGENITLHEASLNQFAALAWANLLGEFGFAFYASYRQYRRGERRTALYLGGAVFVFWVFVMENLFVLSGLLDFIFLAQFGFPALILIMAVGLHSEAYERVQRLQMVVDHLPAAVYMKDLQGRYLLINREYEARYKISRDELLGKTDYEWFDGGRADLFRASDREVLENGNVMEFERALEVNGSLRYFRSFKFPLRGINGEFYAICGISTDVTEHRRTEEALRRSQKMDAVGQLAGGVAHDFNNQLGVIFGYLDMLREAHANDDKGRRWIEIATRATQRCTDLTRQLLEFSRRQASATIPTDINRELVKMDTLIARSITPAIQLKVFPAEDLRYVAVDPGEFQDTILNLVINARDAMPHGGTLVIETANQRIDGSSRERYPNLKAGDYVQITVSDTGIGMHRDTVERIFEPFFTTKAEGKGTGLGLAMVYGFVRRYGGDVRVYSEPDVGTTFLLYLPASVETHPAENGASETAPAMPGGSETILVVDDEADLLMLAEQHLTELGYRVRVANSASRALEAIESEAAIDLLFSDVVMPGGINGYELAERAKKLRPQLKVLLTSGFTAKTVAINGQARFSANLLNKPYRKDELAQRIRAVLDGEAQS